MESEFHQRYLHDLMFNKLVNAFEHLLRESRVEPSDAKKALELAIDHYFKSLKKAYYGN